MTCPNCIKNFKEKKKYFVPLFLEGSALKSVMKSETGRPDKERGFKLLK